MPSSRRTTSPWDSDARNSDASIRSGDLRRRKRVFFLMKTPACDRLTAEDDEFPQESYESLKNPQGASMAESDWMMNGTANCENEGRYFSRISTSTTSSVSSVRRSGAFPRRTTVVS